MGGDERPSEGLWPLRRVEPDLERDRDSHQHATQQMILGVVIALGPANRRTIRQGA